MPKSDQKVSQEAQLKSNWWCSSPAWCNNKEWWHPMSNIDRHSETTSLTQWEGCYHWRESALYCLTELTVGISERRKRSFTRSFWWMQRNVWHQNHAAAYKAHTLGHQLDWVSKRSKRRAWKEYLWQQKVCTFKVDYMATGQTSYNSIGQRIYHYCLSEQQEYSQQECKRNSIFLQPLSCSTWKATCKYLPWFMSTERISHLIWLLFRFKQ